MPKRKKACIITELSPSSRRLQARLASPAQSSSQLYVYTHMHTLTHTTPHRLKYIIRLKKANLQARWDVSATTSTFSSPTPLNPDQSMKTNHAIPPFFFLFHLCVIFPASVQNYLSYRIFFPLVINYRQRKKKRFVICTLTFSDDVAICIN